MSIARQDAWTQDEDLLLAELVLRYIREGSTQLKAFEEVGRQLSRTAAACGFRWNSCVRKQYQSGIEVAKKQRKENKKASGEQIDVEPASPLPALVAEQTEVQAMQGPASVTVDEVIQYLTKMDEFSKLFNKERDQLTNGYNDVKKEYQALQEENNKLKEQLRAVEEDYRSLLQIMDRARKMVILEEDKSHSVKFKMDKNGNLEKVNK
ncbi:RsfA family transcriptional regulator [Peribacillus cavernae]|uniref:RsfA family transcriptional regulator n=1 Tax=Peribacillus cavernae TaxID=1674310 RepID=A0A3S0VQ60_9BACI|nr:RsfA family transcriptional regulator [Peribacillus cavernae]MDQ0217187.1 FtsZ-binding cell division protein ZapB [Peribacillus cavernae]RUQ30342.1 RsfA family transcriptional regulator [Peribacillus cavernae]